MLCFIHQSQQEHQRSLLSILLKGKYSMSSGRSLAVQREAEVGSGEGRFVGSSRGRGKTSSLAQFVVSPRMNDRESPDIKVQHLRRRESALFSSRKACSNVPKAILFKINCTRNFINPARKLKPQKSGQKGHSSLLLATGSCKTLQPSQSKDRELTQTYQGCGQMKQIIIKREQERSIFLPLNITENGNTVKASKVSKVSNLFVFRTMEEPSRVCSLGRLVPVREKVIHEQQFQLGQYPRKVKTERTIEPCQNEGILPSAGANNRKSNPQTEYFASILKTEPLKSSFNVKGSVPRRQGRRKSFKILQANPSILGFNLPSPKV